MVRTYIKKTVRGHYGNKNLEDALKAINDGTPLIRASKEHGIPARTLRRHRDKKKSGTTRKGCFRKTPARASFSRREGIARSHSNDGAIHVRVDCERRQASGI